MQALKLVDREERDDDADNNITTYAVDGDKVYPAAIKYCREIAAGEAEPPVYAAMYRSAIRALPEEAWMHALVPYEEFEGSHEQQVQRNQALELARLVFSAFLREQDGGAVRLHFLNRPVWRLSRVDTPLPNSNAGMLAPKDK